MKGSERRRKDSERQCLTCNENIESAMMPSQECALTKCTVWPEGNGTVLVAKAADTHQEGSVLPASPLPIRERNLQQVNRVRPGQPVSFAAVKCATNASTDWMLEPALQMVGV